MSNSNNSGSGGIGIIGLLGVVFVTLKLCGVIGWSWWWVTFPFWGGLSIALIFVVLCLVVIGASRARRG